MASVSLKGLSKVYPGGVTAVQGVDLEVRDGEFVVLVGPSGCGKSTTLRMVAGLEEISAGELRIGERLVNEVPGRDRDVAMVFQSYALYPHLSVRQNLAFPLERRRAHGSKLLRLASAGYRAAARAEDAALAARVDEAARTLGITALLERKPGALSGGQRQRVAVGRALVREPAVFLFDEPLSNLDAKLRVEMRAELARLHQRLGATMLYVTHDQEEAMTLGDRLVVMEGGVVQQCGTPRDVYDRPANRFVAGFVGTPSMNFLPATLVEDAGAPALDVHGARLALPPSSRARPRAPRRGRARRAPGRARALRRGRPG
ncbi:MAG: ATP-binding cassette domain-containing protein [Planctomycetes bacterium]|nr:ATP-binding cassette domain-containing protein [Planctomycetota bacterium]